MSKRRLNSRFTRFIAGSGFFGLLAICLLVIGGVAFATFGKGVLGDNDKETEPTDSGQQVVERVTNVADTRTTVTTRTTTVPTTATPSTTATPTEPLFVLPGTNAVAKAFSGNTPVYSATMGDWRCHNGADFSGNSGMTVKAVAEGTVKAVEEDAAWGGVVVVDHGFGVQSRYCGVSASVKAGATVKAGDTIGSLIGVPCESADGCHLHLEITVAGAYADPIKTIDREVKYVKAE